MKYKHIMAAHEARMWLSTLAGLGVAFMGFTQAFPDTWASVKNRVRGVKNHFSTKK